MRRCYLQYSEWMVCLHSLSRVKMPLAIRGPFRPLGDCWQSGRRPFMIESHTKPKSFYLVTLSTMKTLKTVVLLSLVTTSAHVLSAPLPTACDVRMPMVVKFPFHSASIPKPYYEKLLEFQRKVRRADFCVMGAVIVVGHADTTEGSANDVGILAEQRASNVSRFFESTGFPNYFLHTDSKGDSQPLNRSVVSEENARVDIDVYAGCPLETCPSPISEDGFRHLKDWSPEKK